MTAQFPEYLRIEGKRYEMHSTPLDDYIERGGELPEFAPNCTALWRGYIGTWTVARDKLYLAKINAVLADGRKATMELLFPAPRKHKRVFADWFSGEIRLPQGKLLAYYHMGFESIYERDLILRFDNGMLISRQIHENHVMPEEQIS